ncbi:MAG: hypothetical protein ACRDT0_24015 [Pseudonocardiaceae bacterium]
MIDTLATVLIIAALLGAAVSAVYVLLKRPPNRLLLGVLSVLEVGLLAQVVTGVVQLVGTRRDIAVLPFVGYLLASLLVLPLAASWAVTERSRWGSAVVVVGCLVVPVLIVRLQQIWAATGV